MPSDDFQSLETKLRRSLMPVALREEATDSIQAMLDELAASAPARTAPQAASRTPWIAVAAAATIALLATTAALLVRPAAPIADTANSVESSVIPGAMHLLDESTRLASVEDAGWHSDPDGGTLQALRVRVVEEDRLLDEDTGLIVNISSPREEMLLTPVSTF
jgi:hypothetical protein